MPPQHAPSIIIKYIEKMVAFGLDDPSQLFTQANFFVVVPDPDDPLVEQLNCLLRLVVYFAIVMVLFGRFASGLFALCTGGMFAHLVNLAGRKKREEKFAYGASASGAPGASAAAGPATACRRPHKDNPFMNALPYDDPTLPGACDVENAGVRREMDRAFNENLFRDVGDVFHRSVSDRQFHTMPSTTVLHDSVAFARNLFGDGGRNCKQHSAYCYGAQPALPGL